MPFPRLALLTLLALIAFAGNSLLCRAALAQGGMDAASFTTIRLGAGALMLWALLALRGARVGVQGSWGSALALFGYAAGFSFAYGQLSTAAGALILFGAVQVFLMSHALARGERMRPLQVLGFGVAAAGLVGLLAPGLTAPPLGAALLMLGAGASWGVYTVRGKGAADPLAVTAGNFARTLPLALALSLVSGLLLEPVRLSPGGVALAVASGALASGLGYAIWYAVLPCLRSTTAATLQLSVPGLAALGGVLLLSESFSLRLALASAAMLGGVALVLLAGRPRPAR